ncbi:MAG: 50S ribosomal protein L15 [Deltaproteobacteria bacterium]|nr:50S ribosomal protein L15 [Deltaproteobacteria bacterium]MBW2051741.1 50S ribosomal protein L15 [Deltaproteobacteria bacterium]MBW2140280.1 50S ribosomal protein L15 [Deltaproteobacteria bacterium]MBW2322123.1 50S ribosomal protein L15 [Deltaproteobacteria bacterium]
MRLHELKPPAGSRKSRRRVGRGSGSGLGKTCGRGHKGQRSRSGGRGKPGYEGGQMPLQRRLPKRGFTNIFRKKYSLINLRDLARFEAGSVIGPEGLAAAGLIKKPTDQVKLLGHGKVDSPLTLKVHGVTASAKAAVEAVGGQVEIISG